MLRILTVQKLWDFNFLGGLAPDLLDGFLIGRYEEKRESFDLFAVKFESGVMQFSGEKSCKWRKWRTQNPTKSLKKLLLRQKDDNIPQVK